MTARSTLYMVIRYSDKRPYGFWSVSSHYTLIGAFDDKEVAEKVKAAAEKKIAENPKYHEDGGTYMQSVSILEVELNNNYLECGKEPYLGGGSYVK